MLLTTAAGQCIRFATTGMRLQGSDLTGVRGCIQLAEGDEVISMAILRYFDAW